ncbi:MAG: PD-(D/E)XK nuclease family protein [Olsenella sp.]|nr:PD-(D/E)XK nuclease family protein [Olsenella sp.]
MTLHIIQTNDYGIVPAPCARVLREAVASTGAAALLAPSLGQALDMQRALADEEGLALGVTCTTPGLWAKERWGVWGDGSAIISAQERYVLLRLVVADASEGDLAGLPATPGLVKTLARLAASSLPWLPLAKDGRVDDADPRAAGLGRGERAVLSLLGAYRGALRERGRVEASEAMVRLPEVLEEAGAAAVPVVLNGVAPASAAERALAVGLAAAAPVCWVVPVDAGPASDVSRDLVATLRSEAGAAGVEVACEEPLGGTGAPVGGDELSRLRASLFRADVAPVEPQGQVRCALALGPLAEAELVCQEVTGLVAEGCADVVVACPDPARTWDALAPKLAARGLLAEGSVQRRVADLPATRAFLGFAAQVAQLQELACSWPEDEQGEEGPVPTLGDMSWWPPRALTDFLLSDASGVARERAYALDLKWRGNRMLSPAQVLAQLQRRASTSDEVARATAALLRGRLSTAALELERGVRARLEARRALDPDEVARAGGAPSQEAGEGCEEGLLSAADCLARVREAAGELASAGLTCSPKAGSGARRTTLATLVGLVGELLSDEAAPSRLELGGAAAVAGGPAAPGLPRVRVCSVREAAALAPRSVDALVVSGLTSAAWPLAPADDAIVALASKLGLDAETDPLKVARRDFAALVAAPSRALVLERAANDAASHPTYPAVVLTECLACYGLGPGDEPAEGSPLRARRLGEGRPGALLAASGRAPGVEGSELPGEPGAIGEASRDMILVPRNAETGLAALSASQIESYLECPYKWFALRRLGLGDNDATFSNVQAGTFAHRVLEVSHRELLARAAVAEGLADEAAIEEDGLEGALADVGFVASARVAPERLDLAHRLVDEEFDRHLRHQRMRATTLRSQSLVPHTATEGLRLDRLRGELESVMDFEATRLEGFSPRHFELRFGGRSARSAHVTYAGIDFVGSVDRVDVDAHGRAVVIDYKHKRAPGFSREYDAFPEGAPAEAAALALPRRVQSLIYAQVVRRLMPELKVVGAVYLSTSGAGAADHEIAGALDANAVEQVMGAAPSERRAQHLVCGAPGTIGFEELLDACEGRVADAVGRMLAGEIPAEPRDKAACSWCPVTDCPRRIR